MSRRNTGTKYIIVVDGYDGAFVKGRVRGLIGMTVTLIDDRHITMNKESISSHQNK